MKKFFLAVAVLLLAAIQAGATATTISVYNSSGGLLYTTSLTFLTNGADNQYQLLGYTSKSANISSITMTDNYIGLTNLVVDGSPVVIPAMNYTGGGPQVFGPGNGITWSSTNLTNQNGSVFGWTGKYDFLANGLWTGALLPGYLGPMIGLNDSWEFFGVQDTMTLAFDTPVTSFSAFFNYVPNSASPSTPEPGTLVMFGSGIIGLAGVLRRKINL